MEQVRQRTKSLLQVDHLRVSFPIYKGLFKRRRGEVKAVDGISFSITEGETIGLVGESGSGKSTTGRAIMRLVALSGGSISLAGQNITALSGVRLRRVRPLMQMIFQDPDASLNPRMTAGAIVAEPLIEHENLSTEQRSERVTNLFYSVGLGAEHLDRFPHEFSGGQKQRIGIARALALQPKLIICDEPIASLDVSIQAQVVNLLKNLQHQYGFSYLFISHDLSMVRYIADHIAVMYLGKIVELATRQQLFESPQHPYTRALLSAVPHPDPVLESTRKRIILDGEIPSAGNPPAGCNFCTRCPEAVSLCHEREPQCQVMPDGRQLACHLY